MRYMGERGSTLKVLAFSLLDEFQQHHDPDLNGRLWPHYYYYRARMTDGFVGYYAVARPFRGWKVDLLVAWVLTDFYHKWE
jgi:hypothetical protein